MADIWEMDSGQSTDIQQRHMPGQAQKQILDGSSAQVRQSLAEFGLASDALREKLLLPAAAITHIHLYHYDHLGTPQALIDPLGQVDWQIELDPWGQHAQGIQPAEAAPADPHAGAAPG